MGIEHEKPAVRSSLLLREQSTLQERMHTDYNEKDAHMNFCECLAQNRTIDYLETGSRNSREVGQDERKESWRVGENLSARCLANESFHHTMISATTAPSSPLAALLPPSGLSTDPT